MAQSGSDNAPYGHRTEGDALMGDTLKTSNFRYAVLEHSGNDKDGYEHFLVSRHRTGGGGPVVGAGQKGGAVAVRRGRVVYGRVRLHRRRAQDIELLPRQGLPDLSPEQFGECAVCRHRLAERAGPSDIGMATARSGGSGPGAGISPFKCGVVGWWRAMFFLYAVQSRQDATDHVAGASGTDVAATAILMRQAVTRHPDPPFFHVISLE